MCKRYLYILTAMFLAMGTAAYAADSQAEAATDEVEAAYTRAIEKRTQDIIDLLELTDEAAKTTVHDTIIRQYRFLRDWHDANDEKLKELKKEGDAGREKMEKVRESLLQQRAKFLSELAAVLNNRQLETVKDKMTYFKVKVTYDAYCGMFPKMTDEEKAVVLDLLKQAREEAIDGGSAEEKSAIFNQYKGKINNYLSRRGYSDKKPGNEAAARNTSAEKERTIPAFPGAEGFGAITPGGRGGRVIVVTSLEDSGPGTFRAACEAEGPRIVLFRVAGIINLKSPVNIDHPFITIAGQTAPGDGVCIAGESTLINTHDVIIRYVRFRRGSIDAQRRDDALGGRPVGRIIIDQCSVSWGLDENLSIYRYIGSVPGDDTPKKLPTEDVTIQWCIISEALDKYNHAFGATQGGRRASIHHNLYACNTARNPSIGYGDGIDWRNNVLFNWQHRTVDGGDATSIVNVVNNYYKPGPATRPNVATRICRPQHLVWASAPDSNPRWYVAGNYVVGAPEVTADNRRGIDFDAAPRGFDPVKYESLKKAAVADKEWKAAPVVTHTAQEAYELVLRHAGARLPVRDAVDNRVTEMVRTGKVTFANGIIITPDDVGGYPRYKTGDVPVDTDGDGMPDEWELKYGLDPKDPSDGAKDSDGDGYTNLEEYLNGTDPTRFIDYTRPENNVCRLRK
jgi:pectate lyase